MLVVFDVDGTLIDSQHAIVAAMSEAYHSNGLPAPDRAAVLSVVGLSVREAVTELGAGALDHPVEAIGAAFKQSFKRMKAEAPALDPLYPGALETIAALGGRGDVRLGLATGNSRRGVERFLDAFGLRPAFVTTQSADDAPSKPHPAMLQQAALEAGVSTEDVVMVGDTSFDMAMALSAGARAIGVSWGYHARERLFAAGAHAVLTRFDELIPALGLRDAGAAA